MSNSVGVAGGDDGGDDCGGGDDDDDDDDVAHEVCGTDNIDCELIAAGDIATSANVNNASVSVD